MLTYQKDFIKFALSQQALQFGEFTLKSGRISPYFFNAGKFNTSEALNKLGQYYAQAINAANPDYDMLFGPAYKGIPLVCSTAISLNQMYQKNMPYAFDRKEAKQHGDKGLIVGAPLQGKILIIDDVITAGTAISYSFTLINNAGAKPAGVIIMLDRQEKGSDNISAITEIQNQFHIPVISIITLDDILSFLEGDSEFEKYYTAVSAYREQYGA